MHTHTQSPSNPLFMAWHYTPLLGGELGWSLEGASDIITHTHNLSLSISLSLLYMTKVCMQQSKKFHLKLPLQSLDTNGFYCMCIQTKRWSSHKKHIIGASGILSSIVTFWQRLVTIKSNTVCYSVHKEEEQGEKTLFQQSVLHLLTMTILQC